MTTHILSFAKWIVTILAIPYCVTLSQPKINLEFPAFGSKNISLIPELKIKINPPYKIDESCLNLTGQLPDENWDSIRNRHIISVITLFPSYYYNGSDSSLKSAIDFGTWTKCDFLNDSTIKIIPLWGLDFSEKYSIYFDDFRVYNPQTNDTLVFDTLFNPLFITTKPMYRVTGSTALWGVIRTEDTVTVYFNRELMSDSTPLGPILYLQEMIESKIGDSTIYNFVDKPYHTWLNPGGESISILTDSAYEQGKEYLLSIYLNRLTGDSADDYYFLLRIRESAMVNLKSRCNDPNDTLPQYCGPLCGNKMFFLTANEEYDIECTPYYDDFFFVGWECDRNDTIQGNWNNKIVINFKPKDLMDLNITAVWARIIKDEVIIHNSPGGTCKGYTPGIQLNDSTYTLPRKAGNWMLVTAQPDYPYCFGQWISNDSTINGNQEWTLMVHAFLNTEETIATKGKPPWLPSDECFNKKIVELTPVYYYCIW